MTVAAGTRLGPYEVQSLLGAGGMGEVYTALDTRLDRTVAIKLLPSHLTDSEHRARFEREARAIGGLSHSHICALYDVGEYGGSMFLVMEHLAGQTLAERLRKGPLPVEQALEVGAQIADALAAAHRRGIVHRDLKPANVMLTNAGAKLLDFGLARLTACAQPALSSFASAPTQSEPLTGRGTILGTLQYMAPEQLEGGEPDARTDIWALGLVLYEMVSGRRAFEARSSASLIGSILEHNPTPLAALRPDVPKALDRLVRRSLAKNPDDRWDSAHDVADELRWIGSSDDHGDDTGVRRRLLSVRWIVFSLAVSALLVIALAILWQRSRGQQLLPRLVQRFELDIAPAEGLRGPDEREMRFDAGRPTRLAFAVSPDERSLVFSAYQGTRQGLWIRNLVRGDIRFLANTEGAEQPFFSPDGRQVGFWSKGAVRKIDFAGGPATPICESEPLQGALWAADGTIVFARLGGPLLRVADSGGTPVAVTTLEGQEAVHSLPQLLPDGQTLLYTADPWPYRVVAENLRSHRRVDVIKGDPTRGEVFDARYVSTGHLIYARRGAIEAAPFDYRTLRISGAPVTIVEDVMQSLGAGSSDLDIGVMQAVVSRAGHLFYVPGGVVPPVSSTLVWRNLSGNRQTLVELRDYIETLRFAPDGTRVALTTSDYPGAPLSKIAILDVKTKTVIPVTDAGASATHPIWVPPDGRRLTFAYSQHLAVEPQMNLFEMPADGSAPPGRLTTSPHYQLPQSWTPDARVLVYDDQPGQMRDDLWTLRTDGNAHSEPLLQTEDREMSAQLSPDGQWLAYQVGRLTPAGQQMGDMQVYVRRFSSQSGAVRVSISTGQAPVWSPDGRTLYYTATTPSGRDPDSKAMMAVDMIDGRPVVGRPQRVLFRGSWFSLNTFRSYDLSSDGKRFLFPEDVPPAPQNISRIHVVLNWTEELSARVPAGR